MAVDDLGANLERDCIAFVDDSATNCAAAEESGLSAICFNGDSADCRTGLISLGFTELRV